MRIAIVGVTGLIGSALADAVVNRGDHVVGVVRSERAVDKRWRAVVWDPSRDDAPLGIFSGCDAVVNLAGAPIAQRWTTSAWGAIEESRVAATGRVVAAMERDGAARLVNASAVGFYGATDVPVDEQSPAGGDRLADLCVRWEQAAMSVPSITETRLRTGIVLARGGGALPRMATPAKFGLGGPLAGGRQWFPWIHIDDAVGLILWALAHDVAGPVNLVAPGIVRQGDFARALGHVLHRPAVLPTPAFALRALLGDAAVVVTKGQQVVPRVAIDGGFAFRFAQVGEALQDLFPA